MAWTSGKHARKKKNIKRMRKIKWEESGLGAPASKGPTALIEEIRHQGMMLAYRGVGEAARSKPSGGQDTSSAKVVRRQRRGATA